MKQTKYNMLPNGLVSDMRGNVNLKMNRMIFTGDRLRMIYFSYYIQEVPWYLRLFYPFVDYLWDEIGVEGRKLEAPFTEGI